MLDRLKKWLAKNSLAQIAFRDPVDEAVKANLAKAAWLHKIHRDGAGEVELASTAHWNLPKHPVPPEWHILTLPG